MTSRTITIQYAVSNFIPSKQIFACDYANAETGATAYSEGDINNACRLWAQSDALLVVARHMKAREASWTKAA